MGDFAPLIDCYAINCRAVDECLNQHWFTRIGKAQKIIETWRTDYNTERPHSSLKYKPRRNSQQHGPLTKRNGRSRLSYMKAPRPRPLLTPPIDGTQMESRLDLRVAL